MRRLAVLLVPIFVLAVLAAPSFGTGVSVGVKNYKFAPKSITIKKGTRVTWNWHSSGVPHDVTGKGWSSGIRTSGHYRHTFRTKGTFTVVCKIHLKSNHMKMTVKVV